MIPHVKESFPSVGQEKLEVLMQHELVLRLDKEDILPSNTNSNMVFVVFGLTVIVFLKPVIPNPASGRSKTKHIDSLLETMKR